MRFDDEEALASFEIIGWWLWRFTMYNPMYWISCLCRFVDRAAFGVMWWTAPAALRELLDEAKDE